MGTPIPDQPVDWSTLKAAITQMAADCVRPSNRPTTEAHKRRIALLAQDEFLKAGSGDHHNAQSAWFAHQMHDALADTRYVADPPGNGYRRFTNGKGFALESATTMHFEKDWFDGRLWEITAASIETLDAAVEQAAARPRGQPTRGRERTGRRSPRGGKKRGSSD